ncbi:MAG: dephospho-CoA kinase [Armatimonadetes bacterium]|nr:dephospho-CoA kinase [Armatimonadota bacterium]
MRIAVTGGICDGKSTVLRMLARLGLPVVAADSFVRDLYANPTFVAGLGRELGGQAVSGGRVNRAWVREQTLLEPHFRRRLNALLHAPVLRLLLERMELEGSGPCFAEVPLLIETACQNRFDRVWVVDAGAKERMRRLKERLRGDEAQARALLATQLPTEAKLPFADRIVRTNRPVASVLLLVTRLVAEVRGRQCA